MNRFGANTLGPHVKALPTVCREDEVFEMIGNVRLKVGRTYIGRFPLRDSSGAYSDFCHVMFAIKHPMAIPRFITHVIANPIE